MKTRKVFALALCMVLVAVVSVAGTFAYLTSKTDVVQNTFTVGKVAITLDEAAVNEDGTVIENADRVKENVYHLLPGHSYVKDPTVHVDENSEKAWLFVKITVNNKAVIEDQLGITIAALGGFDASKWEVMSNTDENDVRTYILAYKTIVKANDDIVVFTDITVPGTVTNEQLALLDDFQITVVASAIQADGFATYADAYPNAQW